MARDRENPPQADATDDAAVAAAMTSVAGDGSPDQSEPEQIGSGRTLVRTRPGYAFHGSTVDVPITSTGVLVTAGQAAEIQAEATKYGEVVFVGDEEG